MNFGRSLICDFFFNAFSQTGLSPYDLSLPPPGSLILPGPCKDKLAQEEVQHCQVSVDVEQLHLHAFTLAWQTERENAFLCVSIIYLCLPNFSECSNIPSQGCSPPFLSTCSSMKCLPFSCFWLHSRLHVLKYSGRGKNEKAMVERLNLESKVRPRRAMKRQSEISM